MQATVKYQIATYSGEITVNCEPDDENELIIATAKRIIRNKAGGFPLGYQSFEIISRD